MTAPSTASLPHYNTDVYADLPANHAAEGVLANGDVYYNAYQMLTPSDTSMLQAVTGQNFDPSTVASEQADGTFQGNPLAAAIGSDRADAAIGLGGITGNVTASYLQSIEAAETNSNGNGTYEGFQISSNELSAANSYLTMNDNDSGTNSSIAVSA